MNFWRQLFRRESELIRTRSTGRPRTYSAESGYVYKYEFSGFRHRSPAGEHSTEFVFTVTTGREPAVPVCILIPDQRLNEWASLGRELTASERFAVVKMLLKRMLDRSGNPRLLEREVNAGRTEVVEIVEQLDL